MDDEGYIYYRSRQKEMMIVGGINVYPVEIENFLLEHPHIAEVQVFGVPDKRYGEIICAWVKPKAGVTIDDVEEVRQFLVSKMAFFKVPKHKFKLTEVMMKELSKPSS
jgi:fatty-acyl-CoA synthase